MTTTRAPITAAAHSPAFNLDLLARLIALNTGVAQSANDQAFACIRSSYPLSIRRYASGTEHNGWVVPENWIVRKALIKKGGDVLFDGMCHPLAVAGYSCSFAGRVSKTELDTHVFFSREVPSAHVFHCTNNYRPWVRTWGFCVPYELFSQWPPGEYDIELETEFENGAMLVGDWIIPGELRDEVVFNAHTCHPCQANDDWSGVVVILELFRWLATQPRRYTYRAVLGPEFLGTVFYLADLPEDERRRIRSGCFLESVGGASPIALQRSFSGSSILDEIAEYVIRAADGAARVAGFRELIGNDETVWEAPGIEIPTISIQRTPYREYHTSEDTLAIISDVRLNETLTVLRRIVEILEADCTVHRRFEGLVALSNPRYNLYVERLDPAVDKSLSDVDLKMGRLQDHLPRYFDGEHTLFQIARHFDVPFEHLRDHIGNFAKHELVTLQPLQTLDEYAALAARRR